MVFSPSTTDYCYKSNFFHWQFKMKHFAKIVFHSPSVLFVGVRLLARSSVFERHVMFAARSGNGLRVQTRPQQLQTPMGALQEYDHLLHQRPVHFSAGLGLKAPQMLQEQLVWTTIAHLFKLPLEYLHVGLHEEAFHGNAVWKRRINAWRVLKQPKHRQNDHKFIEQIMQVISTKK